MKQNFLDNIPDASTAEIFETLLENKSVKIERIVSRGQATPEGKWLTSKRDEWVLLVRGKAGLLFEEKQKEIELKAGDYLLIPAGARHRVTWTDAEGPSLWLTVYF